jgi:uncharacterized protein (TIGR00369 family)
MTMDAARHAEALARVREIFDELIPFNRVLGLRLDRLDPDQATLRFAKRPELVGNFVVGSLHGGVVSAVLDTAGGVVALLGMLARSRRDAEPFDFERFARVGTIDLRVDYLRPATGDAFTATATILRAGRRVTVAHAELHDDAGTLVAIGTGAYIVS